MTNGYWLTLGVILVVVVVDVIIFSIVSKSIVKDIEQYRRNYSPPVKAPKSKSESGENAQS